VTQRSLWVVYVLFLASGATALVYQVAWSRSLSLVFGASFEAVSIVLAAFMAGLAAGGFALGRIGARLGRPLRVYGALEIGVALFALLLPGLLWLVDAIYLRFALDLEGTSDALNAARAAMAFSVLLLPTFCMGGTLPILVRFLVDRHGQLGERLAGLYAINTVGAVVGALTAGFVLLPSIGVWRSELLAASINLVIGIVAIAADGIVLRREIATADSGLAPDRPPAIGLGAPLAQSVPSDADAETSLWPFRLAFWGTGIAGMAALALEVAWSRAIVIASGANTYSFTIMLATFLSGIAIGSWIYRIRAPGRENEAVDFGRIFVMIGLASFVVSYLLPRLPEVALLLNLNRLGGAAGLRADTTFVLSFLVMLGPCVMMGIAFPLAGAARARLGPQVGESVGDLVGLNTLGAIVGSLLAGFVLIPRLGLQQTTQLASAAYLGYGVLVLLASWATTHRQMRGRAWAGAVLALPAVVSLSFLLPRWDSHRLSALPNNDHSLILTEEGRIDFGWGLEQTELLYLREGRGSTVSVIEAGGVRSLLINSKAVATDDVSDVQHEYLLGHLPVLLHSDPKSAAVIGLGAGLTLGGVAAHESIERIVVVEIEPAVRDAAQLFADLHDDALADPRVELVWQDGRNYLQTTRERFDVITADPIHPWAQGAAYLYTTEYYRLVAEHLAPGGIACQWLPLAELSSADLKSVVASFIQNFEHATLWHATGDLLLIGSSAPIEVDLDELGARLRQPRVSRQLARAGLDEPLAILTEMAMDRAAMEDFAEGAIINTDDNLYLEFSSPLSIGINPERHLSMIDSYASDASVVVAAGASDFETREELRAALLGLRRAKSLVVQTAPRWHELMAAPTKAGMQELIDIYVAALQLGPGYQHAEFLLAYCRGILGEILIEEGDLLGAMGQFQQSLELDPGNTTANLHVGLSLANQGDLERALGYFEGAHERTPRSVDAYAAAGQTLIALERFDEALEQLDQAARLRPDLAEIQRLRCLAFEAIDQLEAAVEACRRGLDLNPDSSRITLDLANILYRGGRPMEAIDVLRQATKLGAVLRRRLSWFLSTSLDPTVRNGTEALRMIAPIGRRTNDPHILDGFAAALAELGRFDEALRIAGRGAKIAADRGQSGLEQLLRERMASYEAGRAIRE
jgi:spermidine synthase